MGQDRCSRTRAESTTQVTSSICRMGCGASQVLLTHGYWYYWLACERPNMLPMATRRASAGFALA
jgi:hypothetical protein